MFVSEPERCGRGQPFEREGLIPEEGDDIRSGLSLRGGGTDMTCLGRRHLHVGKLGGEQNGSF